MTPKLGDSAASYGRALRQNALHTCLSAHPMCHCCKTRAGLAAGPLNVVCNVNRRQGLSLAILDVVVPHARIICRSVFFPGFVCFFSFFSFFFHFPVVLCLVQFVFGPVSKQTPSTHSFDHQWIKHGQDRYPPCMCQSASAARMARPLSCFSGHASRA